jgi:hypothetical protein
MSNKIEITQSDREAAANIACQPHQEKLRSGEWDDDPVIQALAYHRKHAHDQGYYDGYTASLETSKWGRCFTQWER